MRSTLCIEPVTRGCRDPLLLSQAQDRIARIEFPELTPSTLCSYAEPWLPGAHLILNGPLRAENVCPPIALASTLNGLDGGRRSGMKGWEICGNVFD